MKYEEWLNEWIELYVKTSCKKHTTERYGQIANRFLIPMLGELELSDLTLPILQRFVGDIIAVPNMYTGRKLSYNYVKSIITILQNSIKTAHLNGYIKENCVNGIKKPTASEKQIVCFSNAEQRTIEHVAVNNKKAKMKGIVVCLHTGIRIGELLALKWTDVDFEKRFISISKTCYDSAIDGKSVRIIDSPKTKSSYRKIPLTAQMLGMLKEMRRNSSCEYVINDKNKPVSIRSYQRSFELLLKKHGIEHKGFHSLRHTFATRAIEFGMDVKTLSEVLGHKNAAITLNRYAHCMWEHKVAMMNKVEKSMC